MRIGIIGAGNIGGTLTRRLTQLGHDVAVANSRGPETLTELADETDATAATAEDAARGAELGFDPVDAGPLAESRRQQPGSPCYAADFDADRLREARAAASPERPAEFRA